MRYEWMDEYLLSKRSVTRDLQPEWNWIRYKLGDRMFAAILLDDNDVPVYINVKLDPVEGSMLREQYADIIPGYYSDKRCWNSVMPDGAVPDELLKRLLDESYRLVLAGMSKKRQREVLGMACCGADCGVCALNGKLCTGCNAACGKVFHAPEGKACPIYACAVNRRRYATCGECPDMPCGIWRATRDPNLSDEAFESSIRERSDRLRSIYAREGKAGEHGV